MNIDHYLLFSQWSQQFSTFFAEVSRCLYQDKACIIEIKTSWHPIVFPLREKLYPSLLPKDVNRYSLLWQTLDIKEIKKWPSRLRVCVCLSRVSAETWHGISVSKHNNARSHTHMHIPTNHLSEIILDAAWNPISPHSPTSKLWYCLCFCQILWRNVNVC